ncbi:response regulator [Bacteriovoracales bacterium]|nr:response regulator [Bacteriovoracales bacterium]
MENKKLLRVLINDDDRAVLEMLKLSVESTGDYRIITSDCTEKSMEITNEFKFDLVITDFNTPVMNGMDLIKEMRSLISLNKKTPILIITGDTDESLKNSAESYNDVKYIKKPFQLSYFHELVKGLLKNDFLR